MEEFAVLDDSMVHRRDLFVYTHALIVGMGDSEVLVFSGDKWDLYCHEQELMEFLQERINGFHLYACAHYIRYPSIYYSLVYAAVNKRNIRGVSKRIRQQFTQAHLAARKASKKRLTEILKK